MSVRSVRLTLALLLVLAPAARATIVSGRVTNPSGQGIATVDLDFVELATGTSVPLVGDRTDALGYYAVDVPPGDYEVQFEPPAGVRWVAEIVPAFTVTGASQALDAQLEAGWLLSARVIDDTGVPQASIALEAARRPTGAIIYSPYRRSDATGRIQICVPAATFDLRFVPPGTTGPLLPKTMAGVVVAADLDLGDVVLERGLRLSGRVVGAGGGSPPLPDVRVTAVDPVTGLPAERASVLTDLAGAYELWLRAGTYRLDVVPGAGSPYLTRRVHGLGLVADLALRDVVLDRGIVVSGLVLDDRARPAQDVDLDFDDAFTGRQFPTLRDNTDGAGAYAVTIRPGTWDVTFEAPAGSGLAMTTLRDTVLPADTTLPTVTLRSSFQVSGRVLAPGGAPAAGVDLDVTESATGLDVPIANDVTDAGGRFTVEVPAGTYDLDFDPPPSSGWGRAVRAAVGVTGDTALADVTLPASVSATVAAIAPGFGPETGGTIVTVTGTGFQQGLRARLGGVSLRGITVTSPTTFVASTGVRPEGLADLVVTNPGAAPVTLAGAFYFDRADPGPVPNVRRDGPLDNDILIDWASTGQAAYRIFRTTDLLAWGDQELLDAVTGNRYRDEGALLVPGLVFYTVR